MNENINTKPFHNSTIPNDWEVKRFGDICQIKGRIGYRGYTVDDIVEKGEGAITLSPSNFRNGFLDYSDCTFISWFKYDESPEIQIENGDILLVKTGSTFGKSAIVNNLKEKATINPQIVVIKEVKSDVQYLSYLISDSIFQKQINEVVVGGAIPTLSQENILNFTIPLPPLFEQKAIAHILGLMDAAINKNNLLIEKKELQKKWLMQMLLTGKKRLKGFEKEKWKKLGAGEIFSSVTQKGFSNEELLSATQDRGMIPRTMLEGRVTMPTTGTEGFKLVEIGDFVISLRSFQGGLEYSYYRGLVSPAYTVLKPKKKINDEFYKFYFKSYDFIGHLAVAVIGIRDGKQISYEDFCFVNIPNPSMEEQTAIAQVLQAADKEIQLMKSKTEKLREEKKGLMQVLLTGKKRLKMK